MVEVNSDEIGRIVDDIISKAEATPDLIRGRTSVDFRKIIPLLGPVIQSYASQARRGQSVKQEVITIARRRLEDRGYSSNEKSNAFNYFKPLQ